MDAEGFGSLQLGLFVFFFSAKIKKGSCFTGNSASGVIGAVHADQALKLAFEDFLVELDGFFGDTCPSEFG